MICNTCGTETREDFCPRCGAMMRPGATPPVPPPVPVESSPEEKKKKRRKPPLRAKMVFWQAIALFLPLAYFFFDTFVLLDKSLFFSSLSGNSYLYLLMERLAGAAYETNSVSEIAEATLGESVTLLHTVSPASLLPDLINGMTDLLPFLLPMLVMVVCVLLCAVSAVFLLITGGRILRIRTFTNLTLLGGFGATFAPLLGTLLLRIWYCVGRGLDAADMSMQRVLPTLESLCVMGILACVLLPALASLHNLAAYAKRESEFVLFPYRVLAKAPFKCIKAVAVLTILACGALVASFFLLPITTVGRGIDISAMTDALVNDLNSILSAFQALATGGESPDFVSVAALVLDLAGILWIPLIFLAGLDVFFSLLRVLFLKKDRLPKKERGRRAMRKVAPRLRSMILTPYITFVVFEIILVIVLLFSTPIAMHLDFGNVENTLSVVYLAMAHIRAFGGITTLYSFLAACGAFLWYTAGQATAALVVRAYDHEES
ncbi:MAG: zinc ribbon domain-containing protein [Clostridia bacterium]|nr:zinc ribbon domain-containing protein [Clostridia bacterium]